MICLQQLFEVSIIHVTATLHSVSFKLLLHRFAIQVASTIVEFTPPNIDVEENEKWLGWWKCEPSGYKKDTRQQNMDHCWPNRNYLTSFSRNNCGILHGERFSSRSPGVITRCVASDCIGPCVLMTHLGRMGRHCRGLLAPSREFSSGNYSGSNPLLRSYVRSEHVSPVYMWRCFKVKMEGGTWGADVGTKEVRRIFPEELAAVIWEMGSCVCGGVFVCVCEQMCVQAGSREGITQGKISGIVGVVL